MKKMLFLVLLMALCTNGFAAGADPFVAKNYTPGSFTLANKGKVSAILYSDNDFLGVKHAVKNLQNDINLVTGIMPALQTTRLEKEPMIIVGTIGQSTVIDELIKNKKLNVAGIAGNWESTIIEVVLQPFPGVASALVIAGSDKRGTIYGIYELSYQIGVSPWHYWADVPVKKSDDLYILAGKHIISSPKVKYRGIFLNDEAPALSGWAKKEFGGFNAKFYTKVFDLILRLKGNYLWPAMWGSAFNDDDPQNPILADEYGIVIGTSHHEPLTRAHDEWKRYKGGKWNYEQNPKQLKEFWESGLQRVADKEKIITVGMRGDGDEPMTQGTATSLLEKIVNDQREIIEKVTKKPASQSPQLWALYKEVQEYYDTGMRVPDDVTLLLCDDNWGNIRKLPKLTEAARSGGYGIYYHFDYVGGPRNYKWLNTNPIQKTWEQMNLAYEYNANQIWIVNVGDLKPMEFPIEFFLDYAWAPDAIPAEKLKTYTVDWAAKQFGVTHANAIARLIDLTLKYNGRIKPELFNEKTYSLINYNEFEQVTSDWQTLKKEADCLDTQLPAEYKDAFYQLVRHPIEAAANLNDLYFAVAKNRLYAKQQRNLTNEMALQVKTFYARDAEITNYYNKIMANGKWDHMMDQTHIGYTNWQQPEENSIPFSDTILISSKPALGLAIEESELAWTGKSTVSQTLPIFEYYQNSSHYIELFNKGKGNVKYEVKAPAYIIIENTSGEFDQLKRLHFTINWAKAPAGKTNSTIVISGNDGSKITVPLTIDNRRFDDKNVQGFVQHKGYIAMEAASFSRKTDSRPVFWKVIPGYGKTAAGVIPVPVTSAIQTLSAGSPHLEYTIYVKDAGDFNLHTYISPTIDFTNSDGLKCAVSIDDQPPVTLNISKDYITDGAWGKSVADNIKIFKTAIKIDQAGKHTLKYWMINPGVVLQKLVLDLGGLKHSFLGPPETFVNQP
ncbi:glycosyl hydrolase 115 family protein [Pedobacter sp.]|uniref:glycosyl hydrolase 115 family protein n=1 Tax=Pedobacter sp. TaxID=1411316 RepID=UPI003D7F1E1B